LRAYLSSGAVNNAIHHMGVHMVLSIVIAIPIPGLRSAFPLDTVLLVQVPDEASVQDTWA
jgi:hypothetical protein